MAPTVRAVATNIHDAAPLSPGPRPKAAMQRTCTAGTSANAIAAMTVPANQPGDHLAARHTDDQQVLTAVPGLILTVMLLSSDVSPVTPGGRPDWASVPKLANRG